MGCSIDLRACEMEAKVIWHVLIVLMNVLIWLWRGRTVAMQHKDIAGHTMQEACPEAVVDCPLHGY